MGAEQIFQCFVNGIMSGSILILVALGLTMIFGIMHIVNFAHGELYMLGAFCLWVFFAELQVPYFLALILSMIIVSGLGIVIERFLFKPFRGDLAPSFIISLGLVMILQTGTLLGFGIEDKAAPTPSGFQGLIHFGGAVLSKERLLVILISAILMVGVWLFIQRTKPGQAMRAVAQDQDAAALQGISIDATASLAMGVGCALAAAAGCLMAPIFYINPYMGAVPIMKAFVVIILGGLGSVGGVFIGGFIIGFVDSFGSTYLSSPIASMMAFGVLILTLIFRPRGFFGHA
jgi:branched-chain amino acid transport system permease protein